MSSYIKNESHDLRLAATIIRMSVKMKNLFGDRVIYESTYGTPPKACHDSTKYINNTVDMFIHLNHLLRSMSSSISEKDTPIGILKVFMTKNLCEKEMLYIPLQKTH